MLALTLDASFHGTRRLRQFAELIKLAFRNFITAKYSNYSPTKMAARHVVHIKNII